MKWVWFGVCLVGGDNIPLYLGGGDPAKGKYTLYLCHAALISQHFLCKKTARRL